MSVTRWIEQLLVDKFGYQHVIKAKDFILCISSAFVGAVVIILLVGIAFYKVTKTDTIGKLSSLRLHVEGNGHFYVNPRNKMEAIEILLFVTFLPRIIKKNYRVQDETKTKIIITIIVIIGVMLTILSCFLIGNPILHPELFK